MSEALSIGYLVIAFALAISGGAFGATIATSHRRLCALISFGAGSLLGVTLFAIVPETMHELRWWGLLLAFGSGYVVFALITKYVCPACAASHFDEATTHRYSEIAGGMMIALAIHCAADGIAIAAGHEAEVAHAPGAHALNISLVLAICVHKIPEGLALGSVLLAAGFRREPAVFRVAAVEAATLLGGLAGLAWLRHIPGVWLAAVVAHAGGGFLFLAIHAILGEIFRDHKALVLVSFGLGLALIGGVALLLHLS